MLLVSQQLGLRFHKITEGRLFNLGSLILKRNVKIVTKREFLFLQ